MDGCDYLLEQPVLFLLHYIHFKKEYGVGSVGTSALSLSACTVFEKRMDSIISVALTAHHTPNLMYCIGTSHCLLNKTCCFENLCD
jgi:hypothetical protein